MCERTTASIVSDSMPIAFRPSPGERRNWRPRQRRHGGKVASAIHLAGGPANAALMLATAALGAAYAGRGVRVVGVNPGLTNTERVAEGMKADARAAGISEDEARARGIARLPLGRMAEPEEIANAVLFLASAKASYVTAVTLGMDGAQVPVVV
jgi:NAD(P)-dependent dehydrogenase (short-subunit alcohol dehydrogenase family)